MTGKEPKPKYFFDYVEVAPDLSSKSVAITGTTSGTGYAAASFAVMKNAKVLMLLNRQSSRSNASKDSLEQVKSEYKSNTEIIQVNCDLMDFASVRSAAKDILTICEERNMGLNVLANNAGIMNFPDTRTKDGYDVQMQTNYLSHYLLTKLLLPAFEKEVNQGHEVRVVQHSAIARNAFGMDIIPKYFVKSAPKTLGGNTFIENFKRYKETKLANICFAMALADQLEQKGYDPKLFKSVAADPGLCTTGLKENTKANFHVEGFMSWVLPWLFEHVLPRFFIFETAEDGALPLIQAAFGDDIENGDYLYPGLGSMGYGKPMKGISKGELSALAKKKGNGNREEQSLKKSNQKLCWELSEQECGPFFP